MIIIFIFCIILGLIFHKSRLVSAIQLSILLIIFSFNTSNPDFIPYFNTYTAVQTGGEYLKYLDRFDPLYKALVHTCNYFGFSFNLFRMIIFGMCMLLIVVGIRKLTDRVSFVLSLYMIFPFVMDCIQIRNFIAEAFVVFSIHYLEDNDAFRNKSNLIKFCICIFIASMFHYIAILYLVFATILLKRQFNKVFYVELLTSIILSSMLLYLGATGLIKASYISEQHVSIYTFVYMSGVVVLLILVLWKNTIKKSGTEHSLDNKAQFLLDFCKNSVVFIPLIILHFDMFRFIRNILIVYACFIGQIISKDHVIGEKIIKKSTSCVGVVAITVLCFGALLWRSAFYPYSISLLEEIIHSVSVQI